MSISDSNSEVKRLNVSKQYLNEATADVFIICGDDENKENIPAHKFVLFSHSDVFDRMFHGSLPEGNVIKLPDVSPNGFRAFLQYFYFDKYIIDIDVIGEVMYLTKKYNIDEYFYACCEFLKRNQIHHTPKHILIGYELAILYELFDLKDFFAEAIINQYEKVLGSDYMRSMSYDLLKYIVQVDYLHFDTKKVFDACMEWAEEACNRANIYPSAQNRRKQLDCFEHIEFGSMRHDEIVQCVTKYDDLFTPQELHRFIIMIAAKCPTPFNEDEIIRYKIGKPTVRRTDLKAKSTAKLQFVSRVRILLGGIAIEPLIHFDNMEITGVLSIRKISKRSNDDVLLLRVPLSIKTTNPIGNKSSTEFLFPEAIIVEPHANYSIQLSFFFATTSEAPYHKHTISPLDDFPFRILSKTNSNAISTLLYILS